jgi:hypothetical protein
LHRPRWHGDNRRTIFQEITMRYLASIALLGVAVAAGLGKPLRETPRSFGEFIDPDKDCEFKVDGGKLTIIVPGTDHDWASSAAR